jgi:hypothetical protein
MTPMSNHMIGQATHREYEAKYGNRYRGEEARKETTPKVIRRKLVLALSGVSVIGAIVSLNILF